MPPVLDTYLNLVNEYERRSNAYKAALNEYEARGVEDADAKAALLKQYDELSLLHREVERWRSALEQQHEAAVG